MRISTLLIRLCIVAVVAAVTSPALSQEKARGAASHDPNEPSSQLPVLHKGMPNPRTMQSSEGPNEPTSRGGASAK